MVADIAGRNLHKSFCAGYSLGNQLFCDSGTGRTDFGIPADLPKLGIDFQSCNYGIFDAHRFLRTLFN